MEVMYQWIDNVFGIPRDMLWVILILIAVSSGSSFLGRIFEQLRSQKEEEVESMKNGMVGPASHWRMAERMAHQALAPPQIQIQGNLLQEPPEPTFDIETREIYDPVQDAVTTVRVAVRRPIDRALRQAYRERDEMQRQIEQARRVSEIAVLDMAADERRIMEHYARKEAQMQPMEGVEEIQEVRVDRKRRIKVQ